MFCLWNSLDLFLDESLRGMKYYKDGINHLDLHVDPSAAETLESASAQQTPVAG